MNCRNGIVLAILFTTMIIICSTKQIMASITHAPEHSMSIKNNAVTFDNKPGRIAYKAAGDLGHDGKIETVFSVMLGCPAFYTVVARPTQCGWTIITAEKSGYDYSRADVADVNGDGNLEVVVRTMSADGHYVCNIDILQNGKLVDIGPQQGYRLGRTRFADIDHDGNLEILSITDPSFGYLGDFWLDIYKWNGRQYVDVSRRFPTQYDRVIRKIRFMIYREQHANNSKGVRHDPAVGDLYYYLGKAYEYRGNPRKASDAYATAIKFSPDTEWIVNAYRRTHKSTR